MVVFLRVPEITHSDGVISKASEITRGDGVIVKGLKTNTQ